MVYQLLHWVYFYIKIDFWKKLFQSFFKFCMKVRNTVVKFLLLQFNLNILPYLNVCWVYMLYTKYTWTCLCAYLSMEVWVCIYVPKCMSIFYIFFIKYICVYTNSHACTHTYIYARMRAQTHLYYFNIYTSF